MQHTKSHLSFPRPRFLEKNKFKTSSSFSASVRCLSIDRIVRSLSLVCDIDVRRAVLISFNFEKDRSQEATDTAVVSTILAAVRTLGKAFGPYLIAESNNSPIDPRPKLGARLALLRDDVEISFKMLTADCVLQVSA